MARARNIKPGFFTNDTLGELPALARLLFAGLWTVCDRAGRVEDRPKKIKAEVLPYDACDADELLSMLEASGFIARYTAGGVRVIQVLSWEKHQNPHVKEAESILPAPDKNSASTGQAPDKEEPKPERAGLIPSSLIPDSLFLDSSSVAKATGGKPPPMPPEEIIFCYGVPLLVSAGSTEKAARSFLGGLRKSAGDDGVVVNALRDCIRAKPLQPLEWLAKAIPPAAVAGKQTALERRNAAVAAELGAMND